jgi:trigger factor
LESVINDITEVEKEIHVQVGADELLPHFEKAYRRFRPRLELKGFRKGKVPLDMVKKIYGEQIEYDSLSDVAGDIYRKIVEEKNIQPVGEPILVDIDYKRGESLAFKIKYEILPTIKLTDYKGVSVQKLVHTTTDKELEDEILRIRRANATMEEVSSVGNDEHIVTADIQELDDTGFPMIGKKSPNQRFYLADESLATEVKTALRTAAVNSPVRIKYESQHDDHTHKYHFEATVKKIEKIVLPELDDAFIAKITKGKTSTVEDFRKNLRVDIERFWEDRSERRLVDAIAGEIIRRHDFAVPESLVTNIVNRQLQDLESRLPDKKLPPEFDEAKYREEARPSALWQAKWFLIRERIIEKEGLSVDDTELESLAEEKSKETGIEKEKLVEFFKNSEETKRQLLSDKLTRFLKTHAKVKEEATEDFF